MHIAKQDHSGTEGCIALSYENMLEFLRIITPQDVIEISMSE